MAAGSDVLEAPSDLTQQAPRHGWAVHLWNDPVNLFDYVVATLMRLLAVPTETAANHTALAHDLGRAQVFEGSRDEAIGIAEKLGAAGLWATVEELS